MSDTDKPCGAFKKEKKGLEALPLQETPVECEYDIILGSIVVTEEGRFYHVQGLRPKDVEIIDRSKEGGTDKCPDSCPPKPNTC